MQATGVTANLSVADLAEARDFSVDFLGLSVEGNRAGSSTSIRPTAARSSSWLREMPRHRSTQ
jgi:hypothetical protein